MICLKACLHRAEAKHASDFPNTNSAWISVFRLISHVGIQFLLDFLDGEGWGEMRCQLQRWRRQLITLANLSRKLTYSLLPRRFTIALQCRIYIVKFWTLPGSKFFQFNAVFGKIWQNLMLAPPGQLAPPPRGNPGSATALKPRALPTKKVQYLQRTFP